MAVPFVDNLTTNMDHSLPLTPGEVLEFGDAKNNKDHFEYIRSYAPYDNIEKKDYPNILITTSLSDLGFYLMNQQNIVQSLEITKLIITCFFLSARWMQVMVLGQEEKNIIEDIAFDYAFALKISNKI